MNITFYKQEGKDTKATLLDLTLSEFTDMLANQKLQDGIKVMPNVPVRDLGIDSDEKLMVIMWK